VTAACFFITETPKNQLAKMNVPKYMAAGLLLVVSASSSSTYESIRSLDKSGQARQLKHAQAAADEQGRLILAFCVDRNKTNANNTTTTNTRRQQHSANDRTHVGGGDDPVVYVLSPSPNDTGTASSFWAHRRRHDSTAVLAHRIFGMGCSCNSYVTCTGLQPDAAWLIQQIRRYGTVVQFRYGSQPLATAAVAALVQLVFWGTHSMDEEEETQQWQSSIQTIWKGEERWGRPIGVRTLVIAPTVPSGMATRQQQRSFSLQIVEPSGAILPCRTFACMGKRSDVIGQKVEQLLLLRDDDTAALEESDIQDVVRQALASVMACPPTQIQVEVITAQGVVERKTWSL
jgi:20S proteasome alpha/beta subunit